MLIIDYFLKVKVPDMLRASLRFKGRDQGIYKVGMKILADVLESR
jgi:translation initiation factor IF-3